jgi:uncharacterized protein YqhQ
MIAVTLFYYLLVALVCAVLIYNLVKAKHWETEILYIVVLLPFLLRLFRLK